MTGSTWPIGRGRSEHGFHSCLGVPLQIQGRVIGSLNIYAKIRRKFTPEDISLLSVLGDHASLAIHKARLYEESRAQKEEATKLYEVTAHLATTLDVDSVLDQIVAKTIDLLGCDASGVYVHDQARGGLVFRRGLHLDPVLTRDLVLEPGEGVAGRAYVERRPVSTADRVDGRGPALHGDGEPAHSVRPARLSRGSHRGPRRGARGAGLLLLRASRVLGPGGPAPLEPRRPRGHRDGQRATLRGGQAAAEPARPDLRLDVRRDDAGGSGRARRDREPPGRGPPGPEGGRPGGERAHRGARVAPRRGPGLPADVRRAALAGRRSRARRGREIWSSAP